MIVILWGGPEDGTKISVPDFCNEVEMTGMGTLVNHLPEGIVPTYVIKYQRTSEETDEGCDVFRYVKHVTTS